MQETAGEHDPQLPMQQGISREVQVFTWDGNSDIRMMSLSKGRQHGGPKLG